MLTDDERKKIVEFWYTSGKSVKKVQRMLCQHYGWGGRDRKKAPHHDQILFTKIDLKTWMNYETISRTMPEKYPLTLAKRLWRTLLSELTLVLINAALTLSISIIRKLQIDYVNVYTPFRETVQYIRILFNKNKMYITMLQVETYLRFLVRV